VHVYEVIIHTGKQCKRQGDPTRLCDLHVYAM